MENKKEKASVVIEALDERWDQQVREMLEAAKEQFKPLLEQVTAYLDSGLIQNTSSEYKKYFLVSLTIDDVLESLLSCNEYLNGAEL